jgi:tRNA uridine 5-carboxymethylaminomethyl modification enzyme
VESAAIPQKMKIDGLIKRPQVTLAGLCEHVAMVEEGLRHIDPTGVEQAEILLKYSDYLLKEQTVAGKMEAMENRPITGKFDYHAIKALSYEAREKLTRLQPETIGRASRIAGVSPADIAILMVHLERVSA